MRILLQEVQEASVTIEGEMVSSIGRGYLIFVGFKEGDDIDIIKKMCDKLLKLRIFPDENGKTNLSLSDVGGNILSVSQFTLYANLKEGNRPSFKTSLPYNEAKPLFALWNNVLRERLPTLQEGVFGADMKVRLLNDGPFTLMLDGEELFSK